MPTNRDLSLDKYGISKLKFRELKYFCLQYNEKKQRIKDIVGLHGVIYDGMPKRNKISSIVENQALKIAKITEDVKIIEQTAIEAEPGIYQHIIENVTEGTPYEYMNIPCGRRQFYQARRKFFYLLSQKR